MKLKAHMSFRVSESKVKEALEAMTSQLKAQQDICTAQFEERLHKQAQTMKAANVASSREHAEMLQHLQDAIIEAKAQASSAKDSFQKELRVRSFKLDVAHAV